MFGTTKDRLVTGLARVQRKLCLYTGSRCDCKYGVTFDEQSGCPEVRQVLEMVSVMTPAEFECITKRAGISSPDVCDGPSIKRIEK